MVSFKRFLRRNDDRWPALLEAIEQLKGRPVEEADEAQWWTALRLGPTSMGQWKSQLNEYLQAFTKGLAREVVDSQGEHGALIAWGTLADRAHSLREEHLHHLLLKAYKPKTSVPAKNLETDVRNFQNATRDKFPEANRKLGS